MKCGVVRVFLRGFAGVGDALARPVESAFTGVSTGAASGAPTIINICELCFVICALELGFGEKYIKRGQFPVKKDIGGRA